MVNIKGAVAAGHPETAHAAEIILQEGGNAFDAVLAALCAACIAEPVLCSLGGGGFLFAHRAGRESIIYDFFAHTPKKRRPNDEIDFYPIIADFGKTRQEFHIGMGSIATPGVIKGLFKIHADLGHMPIDKIIEPACHIARRGVVLNALQAYIFGVVEPIYTANPNCFSQFKSTSKPNRLISKGDIYKAPETANILDALSYEGADLFYRGEIAHKLAKDCRISGGFLTMDDLENYHVIRRNPWKLTLGDNCIQTNSPPSIGGILIAFALELVRELNLPQNSFGTAFHLGVLARIMELTNLARHESGMHEAEDNDIAKVLLRDSVIAAYRNQLDQYLLVTRGTTHISVIDATGNAASLTISNGEGAGYMLPDTGVMLNNMLGEEDINPCGFHHWPPNRRMISMMAPSLIHYNDGSLVALGSGGSNRIRTAILQVLINLLKFGMTLKESVNAPRVHFERGELNLEPGFSPEEVDKMTFSFPNLHHWNDINLFFGGVHAVSYNSQTNHFDGVGDPRRGGISIIVH